ncbi:MAG: hypothetical protein F4X92_10365 [Gammaproteobacteria bacterium]|nr:hypothetical protein [Gammaproteobacteria bacterium]
MADEQNFQIKWAPGFSPIQKKKNIVSLHNEAKRHGISSILEISSKSDELVGKRLSAFSLKITLESKKYPLESVYQGCKVFEQGGPFSQIFNLSPRDAKKYIQSLDCGRLKEFSLLGKSYPTSPKNAFYDWLYIRSLEEHADWIKEKIKYSAFTDIEFNPKKQVNCQARAFAEYISLLKRNKLSEAASDVRILALC